MGNRKKRGTDQGTSEAEDGGTASKVGRDVSSRGQTRPVPSPDKPRNRRRQAPRRRGAAAKKRSAKASPVEVVGKPREAVGVLLLSAALITGLALATFNPADSSLNAGGGETVHNLIGPAGAVWSDLLFQVLGLGAYAIAFGLVLAGLRAFSGRRVFPRLRESAGFMALMLTGGCLAHLLYLDSDLPFPPGGVAGAIFGGALLEAFARTGGFILSAALVLVSLTLTADGVLAGLGWRGLGVLREAFERAVLLVVAGLARWKQYRDHRAALLEEMRAEQSDWSLGGTPPVRNGDSRDNATPPARVIAGGRERDRRLLRPERIKAARDKGRELGRQAAERELRAPAPSPAKANVDGEKGGPLDLTIDFQAEEAIALGQLPHLRPKAGSVKAPERRDDATPPPLPKSRRAKKGPSRAPHLRVASQVLPDVVTDGVSDAKTAARTDGPRPPLSNPISRSTYQIAEPDDLDIPIRAAEPDLDGLGERPEGPKPTRAPQTPPARPSPLAPPNSNAGLSQDRMQEDTADGPAIVDVRPDRDVDAIERAADEQEDKNFDLIEARQFELPSPNLLDIREEERKPIDESVLRQNADKLIKTLNSFGIEGHIREIRPGPVITMYEFVPAPGIKISKIATLADDLAMSMEALRVRIVAPIPGKGAVGIEIPNESTETVFLKELVTHPVYRESKDMLTVALGRDIEGNPRVANLSKMPHLLVAGATGAGKSVSVNSMIMSILFRASPREVRLIMVDPKMLELSVYDGIPHLLLPVVTDPKKASLALRWAVTEMERRYTLLSAMGVRNLASYNKRIATATDQGKTIEVTLTDKLGNQESAVCEHMPYLVVIVDELADLMMVASREVESSIMRLAQMARAAGIHLILATQRPSVDVLTGVIKANFPTRIAFQVASKHDSRTILDQNGAEHLLGKGDMLFLSPGAGGVNRVHGAFVSDEEIERTVNFIKEQGEPEYDESILAAREEDSSGLEADEDKDEMYDQAVAIVAETRVASISMIQRKLRIGYNRAARLVETMESQGIVGPGDGAKPREVLIPEQPLP